MKFTAGFIAVVSAAAPAWAIQLTNSAYAVQAGQPFTLTWSDSEGPVTVTLKNGASTDLKDVEVLASGLTTNSFTWNPPSSLPSDLYAFEVSDSSSKSPNYSPQFTFQGGAASVSASSAASSSAASSSAASTSSSASVSTTLSSLTITSSASATASANSSATITSTNSGNSTTTSSSHSSTRTSTRTSATGTGSESTSTSTPVNTNDSQKLGSPLALILGTIVSLMIFN